jgi:hypothetical protein
MLKSCPSCSYIGNDGEHICPFCKADLATGKPRRAEQSAGGKNVLRSLGGTRTTPILRGAAIPGLIACNYNDDGLSTALRGLKGPYESISRIS